jgi:predicted RNase H-like HicB family nuclease
MGYWAVVEKREKEFYACFPDIVDLEVRSKTIEEIKVLLKESLAERLQFLNKTEKPWPIARFNPTAQTTNPKKIPLYVFEFLYIKTE